MLKAWMKGIDADALSLVVARLAKVSAQGYVDQEQWVKACKQALVGI